MGMIMPAVTRVARPARREAAAVPKAGRARAPVEAAASKTRYFAAVPGEMRRAQKKIQTALPGPAAIANLIPIRGVAADRQTPAPRKGSYIPIYGKSYATRTGS